MVIQRIQSLFLLLSVILSVLFLFIPFGYIEISTSQNSGVMGPLYGSSETALLTPALISAVLAFIAIFLFKKFPLQKLLVSLSAVAASAAIIVLVYFLCSGITGVATAQLYWGGSGLLLIAALICQIMAYRAISSDQRLLRSYNSMR